MKKLTTEVVYACGKCGIGHVKVFHTETENTRGVNINPCKNCKHQYGLKSLEEAALRVIYDSSVPASVPVSERAVEERATLWGCYMEGTDELGISDDILLSVHSTHAGAHQNSMRMQKEYGGKHYTDKVVIHA